MGSLKLDIGNDSNLLQLLGISGVTCPLCGSSNIMHWGIEEIIDYYTNESYGFEYIYECRENSPYHGGTPYMWGIEFKELTEVWSKYKHCFGG